MIKLVNFSFEGELNAVDLNSINTNMLNGVDDIGLLYSLSLGNLWCVVPTGSQEIDSVFVYQKSSDEFYDYTALIRQVEQNPPISPNLVDWANGDYVYIGNDVLYNTLRFFFNPVSASNATLTFEYWKGEWTSFSPTDSTAGFQTSNQIIDWNNSTQTVGWKRARLDDIKTGAFSQTFLDIGIRYWMRIKTGTVSVARITQIIQKDAATVGTYPDLLVSSAGQGLSVIVNPGVAVIDGRFVILPSQLGLDISAPDSTQTGKKWWASVQLTKDGETVVDYGNVATSPNHVKPIVRSDATKLADIELTAGDTTLPSTNIYDQRYFGLM